MLSNWNRTHTLILVVVIGIAGLSYFFGYRTFVEPLQTDLKTVEDETQLYETQLSQLTGEETMDDELTRVGEQVPAEKEPQTVLNELRQMATRSKVDIESIVSSSGEAAEEAQLNEARYSLEVHAKALKEINAFMHAVESGERFMRIDALTVEQDGSVDLSLEITTFYSG
ncbi:hypothetical protein JNUCC1_00628 [Lentibacillus sp. JNUCC-1]|uniref:type 4a pilus biogenesis protein PilO n=1 Tax=Lentibacillus sp. JNUCC-1 TaxID=2654513 RepID=UPI0012E74C90|nr:type 4a pilus biogenesis protein PilO [Lentibacillus sp. JNUCC-1]MUV36824.1 hypothetical protein [Lentibacillus sp. JNUCC-1]